MMKTTTRLLEEVPTTVISDNPGGSREIMKTVRDVIRRTPVWVNPEHTTESAIILMRGHDIGALPVLDGTYLVGMVLYSHLLGVDPQRRVGELMMVDVPTISPDTSIREAAGVIVRAGIGRLPVLEHDRLIGVVTDGDLLPELGRSFDPLTGLAWADTLREWAISHLEAGSEITVLFIDLDNFGQFNKTYGHIVGDDVLKAVANTIADVVKPYTDLLCRYGGDEFCIATLRQADDASSLAQRIQERVAQTSVPSAPEEHISCTIGQRGGRRTREREHTHYAATLNNLINLASRECMAGKTTESSPLPSRVITSADRMPRLQLVSAEVKWRGRMARVEVNLQLGRFDAAGAAAQGTLVLDGVTHYPATASAETDKEGAIQLVAETTVLAVRGVLPEGYEMTLSDVFVNQTTGGQNLVTVVGELNAEDRKTPLAGSALVTNDPYRAAASAVLAAVNRPLALILARR